MPSFSRGEKFKKCSENYYQEPDILLYTPLLFAIVINRVFKPKHRILFIILQLKKEILRSMYWNLSIHLLDIPTSVLRDRSKCFKAETIKIIPLPDVGGPSIPATQWTTYLQTSRLDQPAFVSSNTPIHQTSSYITLANPRLYRRVHFVFLFCCDRLWV